MSLPRVLLVGYGPTAASALRSLAERFEVVAVVRDARGPDDPVVRLAGRHAVPVTGGSSPQEVVAMARVLGADAVVVSSYNRILRFDASGPVAVNVHYAPLPRYRGRAPVNWAIINGEPETAITIHHIDDGLDSGNILFQGRVPIGPRDTAGTLYERLDALQEAHLADAVAAALAGDRGLPQDHALATYGCARLPADGAIDWTRPAEEIDRLVRALGTPFPPAFTVLDGARLSILRATPAVPLPVYAGAVPGRTIGRSPTEGWVEVLAGQGALRLTEVALADGPPVPAASVIRSTRSTLGTDVHDLLRRLSILEARLAEFGADPVAACRRSSGKG